MPHLVVSISGHGFGHVAQTAPVLNALHQMMPQLRLTVRSTVPLAHLRSRIKAPFIHLPSEGDIGMAMSSAVDVCVEESRAAYRAFHAGWEGRIAEEARLLRDLGTDMVLSNTGYLPLAGAQQAGIPNAALCSLNWFDIYRHYCGDASDSIHAYPSTGSGRTVDEIIAAQIHACYANADAFLRIAPGLAMEHLPNIVPIAPIAAVGHNRRDEIDRHLKLSKQEKLVLVSLGGIAGRLPIERWPRIGGVRWLVQQDWQVEHPDAIAIESLPMDFSDLLASSDALICKPGYGSFVEAACSGTPVLYVSRADWPETHALAEWLRQHGLCREISRDALEQGNFAGELKEICDAPRPNPVIPEGAGQAANWVAERLQRQLQ
jgi:UDP:flavonoid glycosyltransferase YjiC (YdhE family)